MARVRELHNRNNVGSPGGTYAMAEERGDRHAHRTVLRVQSTLPAIAGGANLAVGKLLYTFPAGEVIVRAASMSMAIKQTQGFINADTPDVGLGTVVASGAVALLSGTATFEDILTGQTAADCNGTATVKTVSNQVLTVATASAHTVYFNVADLWAASGDAAALIYGTVVLDWTFMGA